MKLIRAMAQGKDGSLLALRNPTKDIAGRDLIAFNCAWAIRRLAKEQLRRAKQENDLTTLNKRLAATANCRKMTGKDSL
jgi:hypothetical protein